MTDTLSASESLFLQIFLFEHRELAFLVPLLRTYSGKLAAILSVSGSFPSTYRKFGFLPSRHFPSLSGAQKECAGQMARFGDRERFVMDLAEVDRVG